MRRFPRNLTLFFALASGIIYLLPLWQHRDAAASIVARVNDHEITLEELNQKYTEAQGFAQYQGTTKQAVLEELIKRQLGIQEAKRLTLDQDPEVLNKINTVLYQVLIERQLNKEFEKIHVSDDEAQAYYTQYPEIRTSHIFIAVRPGATKKEENAALQKLKTIQNTHLKQEQKSFAEVAQKYSEASSAKNGGDLGYQTRTQQVDPAYYDAARKLTAPGQISDPIRTRLGYHLIELTAVRPWDKIDQAAIKQRVFETKRVKIFENYMSSLRNQAKIQTNTELLKD